MCVFLNVCVSLFPYMYVRLSSSLMYSFLFFFRLSKVVVPLLDKKKLFEPRIELGTFSVLD
jgi:hypothetical protein